MYETNAPQPQRFLPPPPTQKKPPPPPPRKLGPVEEFMNVTGVTDPEVAAQHIAKAAQLGKSVKDAIRYYFEYGGRPMDASEPRDAQAGAYQGIVGQLVEMGFDRDLAVRAAGCCKTLDEAAEWCLREGGDARGASASRHSSVDFPVPPPAYQQPVPPPAYQQPVPYQTPPPPYSADPPFRKPVVPPVPPFRDPPAYGATLDSPSARLFEAPTKPKIDPAEYNGHVAQMPNTKDFAMPELETPIVVATNPYGNPPMHVLSMPPSGVLSGAAEADEARRLAAKVQFAGKLLKMSGGKSRLGQRWQARHFVVNDSSLAYGDDEKGSEKKRFALWGSYVVPEPPTRASGKEHALAVYRSDVDVFAAAGSSAVEEREQLLLLAAEDDGTRARWICALLKAAGRPGVLLRVGEDHAAVRLRCSYGGEPLELEAGAVGPNVLVRKVLKSKGAGAVGVRVGDELVSVNGANVPLLTAAQVKRMLEACSRPLELELRRARDPTTAKELAAKAVLSLGTDADDEGFRQQQMQEALHIGAALRADKASREEMRQRQAHAAQAEAAAVSDAIARSTLETKQKEISNNAVQATLAAVRATNDGDAALQQGDAKAAQAHYKAALDSLMSAQEPLADPDGEPRKAVARALPDVSLADLYDHINANGAKAAELAVRPPDIASLAIAPPGVPPAQAAPLPAQDGTPATALFDYQPQEDWQLVMRAGDKLLVIDEHNDGWSDVCLAHPDAVSTRGLVPTSYIQVQGQTSSV